jgi:hypothetical protein
MRSGSTYTIGITSDMTTSPPENRRVSIVSCYHSSSSRLLTYIKPHRANLVAFLPAARANSGQSRADRWLQECAVSKSRCHRRSSWHFRSVLLLYPAAARERELAEQSPQSTAYASILQRGTAAKSMPLAVRCDHAWADADCCGRGLQGDSRSRSVSPVACQRQTHQIMLPTGGLGEAEEDHCVEKKMRTRDGIESSSMNARGKQRSWWYAGAHGGQSRSAPAPAVSLRW